MATDLRAFMEIRTTMIEHQLHLSDNYEDRMFNIVVPAYKSGTMLDIFIDCFRDADI